MDHEQAVLITNGTAFQSEYVSQDQVAAADYVFRFSRNITTDEYNALVAAGYSTNIQVV